MRAHNMYLQMVCSALLASPLLLASGCSSHRTTTTTTTEVSQPRDGYAGSPVEVSRTETKTTEVENEDRHRGLFGIIGDIIALPFRAVGALFMAIF